VPEGAIAAQMLHAVTYLHQQDVWHRDLKSSNVLMAHMYGQRIIKARRSMGAASFPCVRSCAGSGAAFACTAELQCGWCHAFQ
jgi:hypothetical protein